MTAEDKKKFSRFYREYADAILKHIFFRVGNNRHLAEDLAQEAFLRTWKYAAVDRKKIKNFRDFLYMVANNLIIDHYRSREKLPLPLHKVAGNAGLTVDPDAVGRAERIIRARMVKKHLSNMKELNREIINYRFERDLSVREIGRLTNRSPNHVSVIIHRSIVEIRKKLNLL